MYAVKDIKKGSQLFWNYNNGGMGEYNTENFY
jgi:hypothetical protein